MSPRNFPQNTADYTKPPRPNQARRFIKTSSIWKSQSAVHRERAFADFMGADPLPENFRRALAGERTTVAVPGIGEVTLAPNVHVRKTVGVVGSVRREA